MTKDNHGPTFTPALLTAPEGEPPDAEDLARFRDFMREPVVINPEEVEGLRQSLPRGWHSKSRAERSAEMTRPRTGPPFFGRGSEDRADE